MDTPQPASGAGQGAPGRDPRIPPRRGRRRDRTSSASGHVSGAFGRDHAWRRTRAHRSTARPRPRGDGTAGPLGIPAGPHKEILDRLARSKVCGAIRVADHCRSLPRGATKTSARGRSWRRWTFEFCQSGARRLATFSRQAGPPTSVLYFRHSNLRSNRRDIRPILRSKCSNTVARRTSGWLVQRANQARRAPYQLVSP